MLYAKFWNQSETTNHIWTKKYINSVANNIVTESETCNFKAFEISRSNTDQYKNDHSLWTPFQIGTTLMKVYFQLPLLTQSITCYTSTTKYHRTLSPVAAKVITSFCIQKQMILYRGFLTPSLPHVGYIRQYNCVTICPASDISKTLFFVYIPFIDDVMEYSDF